MGRVPCHTARRHHEAPSSTGQVTHVEAVRWGGCLARTRLPAARARACHLLPTSAWPPLKIRDIVDPVLEARGWAGRWGFGAREARALGLPRAWVQHAATCSALLFSLLSACMALRKGRLPGTLTAIGSQGCPGAGLQPCSPRSTHSVAAACHGAAHLGDGQAAVMALGGTRSALPCALLGASVTHAPVCVLVNTRHRRVVYEKAAVVGYFRTLNPSKGGRDIIVAGAPPPAVAQCELHAVGCCCGQLVRARAAQGHGSAARHPGSSSKMSAPYQCN